VGTAQTAPRTVGELGVWIRVLHTEQRGPTEPELRAVEQVVRAVSDDPLHYQLASLGLLHAAYVEETRRQTAAAEAAHVLAERRVELAARVWGEARGKVLGGMLIGAAAATGVLLLIVLLPPLVYVLSLLIPANLLEAVLELLTAALS
jgi:hypothetical protein